MLGCGRWDEHHCVHCPELGVRTSVGSPPTSGPIPRLLPTAARLSFGGKAPLLFWVFSSELCLPPPTHSHQVG